jgi:hypothetical protein
MALLPRPRDAIVSLQLSAAQELEGWQHVWTNSALMALDQMLLQVEDLSLLVVVLSDQRVGKSVE